MKPVMLEKERTVEKYNCCLWPFRVISGAGAVECPMSAPSEISLHVPAENNVRLMSVVGHAGVSFTLQGKGFITPFS